MFERYLNEKRYEIDKGLEMFLLKSFHNGSFEIISKPIQELLARGGKRWRPIFMILCCYAIEGNKEIKKLIPLVEIIHNGTLIIDDIEDNSDKRRGKPSIHKIFGIDVAINSGNMMYFLPSSIIKDLRLLDKTKLKIHEIVSEEMINLHLGQGLDIDWHNNGKGVTESMYMQMCSFKTGCLARMAARIGALVGCASEKQSKALSDFAEALGIAFQIQDDILNISNKKWGKEFGEDITEGKKSLMVIKVLEVGAKEDKERLLKILGMKTKDEKLIKEAIFIIEKYKAIEYAKEKAKEVVEKSWKKVDRLLKETEYKNKLRLFCEFVVDREI